MSFIRPVWIVLWVRTTAFLRREEGQTTAEYALVILAAAAIAVVLIAWARCASAGCTGRRDTSSHG